VLAEPAPDVNWKRGKKTLSGHEQVPKLQLYLIHLKKVEKITKRGRCSTKKCSFLGKVYDVSQ
jgi:hypothetical protein